MLLSICFCACVVVNAEEGQAEIDGVVYSYYISGANRRVVRKGQMVKNGNRRVFLGTQSPACAVRIPDDRKLLSIPKVINGNKIDEIQGRACQHLADVEEIVLPEGYCPSITKGTKILSWVKTMSCSIA